MATTNSTIELTSAFLRRSHCLNVVPSNWFHTLARRRRSIRKDASSEWWNQDVANALLAHLGLRTRFNGAAVFSQLQGQQYRSVRRRLDADWWGKLASLFLEIGGGLNEPGDHLWIGSRLCHFEKATAACRAWKRFWDTVTAVWRFTA